MLVQHAHGSFDIASHGVHYAVLGVGVLGLVALLVPRFLSPPEDTARDEQDARVLALRSGPAGHHSAATSDAHPVASQQESPHRAPAMTVSQQVLLPLAVVSSAAAAGVHAAVAPEHVRESLLFGAFFLGSALLQLLWAGQAAVHCSRRLLRVGAAGNLAVIGLWAVTRTLGLPFGLLPEPEAVGPWDVACAGWELVVVCSCIAMLQSRVPVPKRLPDWRHWHPAVATYAAASALLLVALSVSGAGA